MAVSPFSASLAQPPSQDSYVAVLGRKEDQPRMPETEQQPPIPLLGGPSSVLRD